MSFSEIVTWAGLAPLAAVIATVTCPVDLGLTTVEEELISCCKEVVKSDFSIEPETILALIILSLLIAN